MAGIPRATYRAAVAWDKFASGYFTIGRSRIAPVGAVATTDVIYPSTTLYPSLTVPGAITGYQGLAPSAFGSKFLGALDDISGDVSDYDITRGRDDSISLIESGQQTLTLRDSYVSGGVKVQGKYNVQKTGSPLYGKIKPLRPMHVVATYAGVEYPLGYGFLSEGDSRPGPRKGTATLEFVDFFLWLGDEARPSGGARPIIDPTGPITTGEAIGLLLDAVGWTEPGMRDLAVGDVIPDFSADGTKTALELIEALLTAERGVFFITGAGVAKYQSRHDRAKEASAATIADGFVAMPTGFALATLRTRSRVLRLGGVLQEYVDELAAQEYGFRDFDQIETPYLRNDAQAHSLASWLVSQAKDPRPLIWSLELEGRTPALLTQILARDVGDRVTVTESVQGTTMDAFIERVEHEVGEQGPHKCRWLLSRRSTHNPFRIGVSKIGGPDRITY